MSQNLEGGIILKKYRVERFISARGGMKIVYKARDLEGNFSVALKELKSNLTEDPSMLRIFRREAETIQHLAHPNIVRFYGWGQENDTVYLIEQFIDGPSLEEILKSRKNKIVPVKEVLLYLKGLCNALGLAHQEGIVHCDVKPGNVMIDQTGMVLLTDFGIARHAGSDSTSTLAGAGTPAYMAPEQAREDSVTPETDIYALGVMLYEMLTGQRPFRGNEPELTEHGITQNERIRYAHRILTPPDPRSINPQISNEIARVVLKALAKNPNQRFPSAQAFFYSLCQAAGYAPETIDDCVPIPTWQGEPSTGTRGNSGPGTRSSDAAGLGSAQRVVPTPESSRTTAPPKRKGLYLVIAGGVFLLLIFFIARPGRQSIPSVPGPNPTPAVMGMNLTPTQPGKTDAEVNPSYTEPTSQPVEPKQPTQANQPVQPTEMSQTAESQPITPSNPGTLSGASTLRIAYAIGDPGNAGVHIADADGRNEQKVDDLGCKDDAEPSLSPVGDLLVFQEKCSSSDTYNLILVDAASLQRIGVLTDDTSTDELEPDWSPDGNQVVYHSNSAGKKTAEIGELHIIEVNSRQDRDLHVRGKGPAWSPDGAKIAFTSNENGNIWQIYVLDLNSMQIAQITRGSTDSRWPAWSPDGKFLVYNTAGGGSLTPAGIWIVPASGGTPQQVTQPGVHGRPCWSAQGGLAFYTNQDGIYIIQPDGSGKRLLKTRNAVIGIDWSW